MLLIAAAIILFVGSCEERGKIPCTYYGEALGTTYQLKFFSDTDIDPRPGLDSIFALVNASMSTYLPDSDISRINRGDTTIKVEENFIKVFEYSDKVFRETGGYFDPTVGNLVNSYGFGPDDKLQDLNPRELDSMLRFVGFDKLQITAGGNVIKEREEIYLDFNAIAKGYTVDVIADYLDKNGVAHYLVEIGGELVAKGENLETGNPWAVAIDDPLQTAGRRDFQAVLALTDRAMATSGNYRKFRLDEETGRHYVHTVNPVTGLAEKSDLLSASVLAENCALADGYATAFMAMGFERSKKVLAELTEVDVYFIYVKENGEIALFTTPGFQKAIISE